VNRHCCRPGCAEAATATLSYHYAVSHAWLDDLAPERDPHGYDLCDRHAARVTVPHRWELDDRRVPHAQLPALRAG
jgi:hypothetical protein